MTGGNGSTIEASVNEAKVMTTTLARGNAAAEAWTRPSSFDSTDKTAHQDLTKQELEKGK